MKFDFKGRFWMARLGFLAACAILSASTFSLWIDYFIRSSAPLGTSFSAPEVLTGPETDPAFVRNFTQLNDKNVFNAKREKISLVEILDDKTDAQAGDWRDAQATSLPLKLIGTSVFEDSNYSLATIEYSGQIGTYSLLDCPDAQTKVDPLFEEILGPSVTKPLMSCNQISDVATVKRIEEQRVYIYNQRDRRYEYLSMLDGSKVRPIQPPKVSLPSTSNSEGGFGKTIKQTGPSSYEIDAKDFESTMGNLAQIATQARIVPAFEDGKSIGFKIFNIVPGSVYEKVGLKNGDIITKINGYELNSPDKALELYQMRSSAKQLNIDYKRGGSTYSSDVSILGRP